MEAEVLNKKKLLVPKLRFKGFHEEWRKFLMNEIATKITDGTHDTPKPISEGVPYLTAIHVKDGKIDFDSCYYLNQKDHDIIYKRCNPELGDLLVVNIGAGTATCASVTVDYEFSLKNVALIKPNRKIVYPDYLSQLQRQNAKRLFLQLTSGGAQPFLSLKELGKLKINIPSLPEQQKIASFLSAVDEKIQQLTRKRELLEQYKKGVMQQLFSGKLRFKDENGKAFQKWEEKVLGEITTEVKRNLKDKSDLSDLTVLTISSEKGFISQKERFSQVIAGESLSKYTLLEKGGMSYNRGASKRFRYGCFFIMNKFEQALVPNVYISFEFKTSCFADYFNQLFSTGFANNQLKKFISSSVRLDGLLNINRADFYSIKIAVPTFSEQKKVASYLSSIDNKIENLEKQIIKTQTFKKGLLQQMFV